GNIGFPGVQVAGTTSRTMKTTFCVYVALFIAPAHGCLWFPSTSVAHCLLQRFTTKGCLTIKMQVIRHIEPCPKAEKYSALQLRSLAREKKKGQTGSARMLRA
ncbi:unnamed protein product, partial [Sphacelaria rigidula]